MSVAPAAWAPWRCSYPSFIRCPVCEKHIRVKRLLRKCSAAKPLLASEPRRTIPASVNSSQLRKSVSPTAGPTSDSDESAELSANYFVSDDDREAEKYKLYWWQKIQAVVKRDPKSSVFRKLYYTLIFTGVKSVNSKHKSVLMCNMSRRMLLWCVFGSGSCVAAAFASCV